VVSLPLPSPRPPPRPSPPLRSPPLFGDRTSPSPSPHPSGLAGVLPRWLFGARPNSTTEREWAPGRPMELDFRGPHNAVVLHRTGDFRLSPPVLHALSEVAHTMEPFRTEVQLHAGQLSPEWQDALLAPLRTPLPPSAYTWLRRDLTHLTAEFARLAGTFCITVKLDLLDSTPCTRYHEDKVRVRLLCTYLGPGTEWLVDEGVDRLRLYGASGPEGNAAIAKGAPPLVTRDGQVLLLRGRWPGSGPGAVHRSPTLAPTERRLLLVLSTH